MHIITLEIKYSPLYFVNYFQTHVDTRGRFCAVIYSLDNAQRYSEATEP